MKISPMKKPFLNCHTSFIVSLLLVIHTQLTLSFAPSSIISPSGGIRPQYLHSDHTIEGSQCGAVTALDASSRYDNLLEELGFSSNDEATTSETECEELRQVSKIFKNQRSRQISTEDVFCNRELQFSNIEAIGFDMDYTLVQYKQPAFDQLAFDGAKEKLVYKLGYPKEVLDLEYDHEFWTRGLIIDIQKGNFLKIDRHKVSSILNISVLSTIV